MWIEIFEKTERDAIELLNRLEYMYLNIKSHKEKDTPYDQRIIQYLNAWGLNKQDNPDIYLSSTNKIWEKVKFNLNRMREHLGNKNPGFSIASLMELGTLMRYLEEVMYLWFPGEDHLKTHGDFLFEIVSSLNAQIYNLGKLEDQINDIQKVSLSIISELDMNNPWLKYATKP